jgi:hypothetical protein
MIMACVGSSLQEKQRLESYTNQNRVPPCLKAVVAAVSTVAAAVKENSVFGFDPS